MVKGFAVSLSLNPRDAGTKSKMHIIDVLSSILLFLLFNFIFSLILKMMVPKRDSSMASLQRIVLAPVFFKRGLELSSLGLICKIAELHLLTHGQAAPVLPLPLYMCCHRLCEQLQILQQK